jgi:hypothetical protein
MAVYVEGYKELQAALRQIASTLPAALREINLDVATDLVPAARQLVRSRTGRLAASVRPLASQRAATLAAGGARIPYAPLNHWGSRRYHYPRNAFLWNTIQNKEPLIVDQYAAAIGDLIDHVWRIVK